MKIKKIISDVKLPKKAYSTDCGLDCFLPEEITIEPGETKCVGLGFGIEVPTGYATMFIPRSSTAKKGLIIQTSVVDCGYKGEVHLIITNASRISYHFNKDDRLCSMITYKILEEELEEVKNFNSDSERGENGLGSTGK